MWLPYHDTITLHDYHVTSYLIALMQGMGAPLFIGAAFVVLPCDNFHTLLYKISNSRIFVILIQLYKISNFRELLPCHGACQLLSLSYF